jgi:hypothetical protein
LKLSGGHAGGHLRLPVKGWMGKVNSTSYFYMRGKCSLTMVHANTRAVLLEEASTHREEKLIMVAVLRKKKQKTYAILIDETESLSQNA